MTMAWIAAGTAVVGAVAGANAASSAANTQADAAKNASQASLTATQQTNAMQQGMYNQGQYNQSPFLQSGQLANAALTAGLGLGNPYAQTGPNYSSGVNNPAPGTAQAQNVTFGGNPLTTPVAAPGTPAGPGLTALGTPGAAPAASGGALNPVGSTVGAGGAAGTFQNAQGQTVDANGNPVSAASGPVNYGASAGQLNSAAQSQIGANGQGNFTQQFTPQTTNLDPSMGFVLSQGNKALNAAQAARGQTGSSQGMQDLINYNQGAASQFYQQGFNNFLTNQNTQYNRLANLAQIGQNTAVGGASQGIQAGANMANTTMSGVNSSNNYLTGGAAAQAAGTVGQANAITGGINTGMNAYMGNQFLNNMSNQNQNNNSNQYSGYTPPTSSMTPNIYGQPGGSLPGQTSLTPTSTITG